MKEVYLLTSNRRFPPLFVYSETLKDSGTHFDRLFKNFEFSRVEHTLRLVHVKFRHKFIFFTFQDNL